MSRAAGDPFGMCPRGLDQLERATLKNTSPFGWGLTVKVRNQGWFTSTYHSGDLSMDKFWASLGPPLEKPPFGGWEFLTEKGLQPN